MEKISDLNLNLINDVSDETGRTNTRKVCMY